MTLKNIVVIFLYNLYHHDQSPQKNDARYGRVRTCNPLISQTYI